MGKKHKVYWLLLSRISSDNFRKHVIQYPGRCPTTSYLSWSWPTHPTETKDAVPYVWLCGEFTSHMITKPSFYRVTKPTTMHLSHTGWSDGTYHYDTYMHFNHGVHTHHTDVVTSIYDRVVVTVPDVLVLIVIDVERVCFTSTISTLGSREMWHPLMLTDRSEWETDTHLWTWWWYWTLKTWMSTCSPRISSSPCCLSVRMRKQ